MEAFLYMENNMNLQKYVIDNLLMKNGGVSYIKSTANPRLNYFGHYGHLSRIYRAKR